MKDAQSQATTDTSARQDRPAGSPERDNSAQPALAGSTALKKNSFGWVSLVFFIIATNGPMTSIAGGVPVSIFLGNGIGLPGSYLVAEVAYLIFAAGFSRMVPHVKSRGAFYAYISRGLGPIPGMGAATMAIVAYTAMVLGCYAMFGYFTATLISQVVGVSLPWWLLALVSAGVVQVCCARGMEFSGKMMLILLTAEIAVILLCNVLVLTTKDFGATGGFDLRSFDPSNVFTSAFGPSLVFVVASFMGFETAAIYSSEVRNPNKAVPWAMYASIVVIGGVYVTSISVMMNYYGLDRVVDRAAADPGTLWFAMFTDLAGPVAAQIATVFMVTSLFAACLSFTNVLARYWHALAESGLAPAVLQRTHARNSSPHLASGLQMVIMMVLIALSALLGLDPMAQVLPWASAPAAVGVLTIQLMTAISVLVFFSRHRHAAPRLLTHVFPVISTVIFGYFLYQLITNASTLAATAGVLPYLLVGSVLVLGAIAAVAGIVLRRRQAERYRRLVDIVS